MRPSLIQPAIVKIARLDRSATEWDPDFKEPIGTVRYSSPIEMKAQVKYELAGQREMSAAGESPRTLGHLTMTREAFDMAGGFEKGDKIVEIGGLSVEAYITEIRPAGHYHGKATLIILMFESRREVP